MTDYADEGTDPGHYGRYNMRLTARQYPPVDGATVNLVASFGDPAVPPMDVDAHWWSRAADEQAARAAGFTVTWTHFSVSRTP
jgi:hypothetical protein